MIAGAVVAVLVMAADLPGVVTIPVVVASGILLGSLKVFGDMSGWVATVALFVLVIGYADPVNYLLAYTGLTLMGALVATAVTMALPTVPTAQTTKALRQLATTLADQLEDLARGVGADDPPTSEQWRERSQAIAPVLASVRASSQDVRSSLRGNARARRERGVVDRQRDEAIILGAVAVRVEDLTDLLLDVRGVQTSRVAVDPTLRQPAAQVLHAAADAVRPLAELEEPRQGDLQAVGEKLQRLSAAVESDPPGTVRDRHAAGAVVTALRRLLGALALAADHSDDDDNVVRPSEPATRTPR